MAKGYWWQKVSDPDAVVRAASRPVQDKRLRYSTMLHNAGVWRNEPDVVRAMVNADVPFALAQRSYHAFAASKARGVQRHMGEAGFSEKSLEPSISHLESEREDEEKRDEKRDDGGGGIWGFLGTLGAGVGTGFKGASDAILTGANALWEGVTLPWHAGYATDDKFDSTLEGVARSQQALPFGAGMGAVTLAGLIGGVKNYGEGVLRLTVPHEAAVSPEQRQDIRRGGGDPAKVLDRAKFYFQDFGEKRMPVSDGDVKWLKNMGKYAPEDVDAAREIVTSGALEDIIRSYPSLSSRAQDLYVRANSDKDAGQLLRAMSDATQTSLGGRLVRMAAPDAAPGDWFGPGSASRGIAAGVAELIATWHVDPLVLATKGYQAVRNTRYAVNLTKDAKGDAFDHVVQMMKASDDNYAPKGAVAKRFEQAMDTVDQVAIALAKGAEGRIEAAKLRQSWIRRYPGYDRTLDVLLGMRNGSIGQLRIRSREEQVKDIKEAVEQKRGARPWIAEMTGDGTPLWRFTAEDGTKLSAEARALEREKVANELSKFIVMDAAASGRELTSSRLLLPGQLSINGKLRDVAAPVLEAFTRRDRSVLKQLDEVGTKPINLNGHLLADEAGRWDTLVRPESSEWYRNNYTFGITHLFARSGRALERTFSNLSFSPVSPDSVNTFARVVTQYMPKRQAQMMTTMYAGANPAERLAMWRQTVASFANTMNFRNEPGAQLIVERLTKGLVPPDSKLINGYKTGAKEYYTTPEKNFVRVGDHSMPAAVHPWQLAESFTLPNLREMRHLANRGLALKLVTRSVDGEIANSLVRAWKGFKVTTWANMMRQLTELGGFTAWRDPKAFIQLLQARKPVKAAILEGRADVRDVKRLANKVNDLNADDLDLLDEVRRTDPGEFINTLQGLLQKSGFDPGAAEVLSRMGESADIAQWWGQLNIRGGAKAAWLATVGPWDALRRVRAERLRRKGGELTDSPVDRYLDDDMLQAMTTAAVRQLGYSAESYAWNTAERWHNTQRELVLDAAGKGIAMRPVKIDNGYKWLGSHADVGAKLWSAELGRRLNDRTGKLTAQLIAHRYLAGKALNAQGVTRGQAAVDVDAITAKQLKHITDSLGTLHTKLRNPDDLMAYLYGEHELGAVMRTNAIRMQYLPDGTLAANAAERMIAAQRAARDAVDDLVYHLGGKVTRFAGEQVYQRGRVPFMKGWQPPRSPDRVFVDFPDEMEPILRKIAKGQTVSTDDLAKMPPEVRPEGMAAPIHAPMVPMGEGRFRGLANIVSRAYSTVVAQPMENLGLLPAFIAQKRVAYGELNPLMEAMVSRGMPESQAAYMLESMVTNRAIVRVFNTADNPSERTVFAEMGDKWLMFNRANLDFLRRLIAASKASPVGIARANMLVQAGVHSGIMHEEPYQDENGNTETRLTFTYPGTALAQRAVADVGVALGLYPDELSRVPQFDGLKSQVRFLNPGISNPISFSANPIFGMAIDGIEKIWPGAYVDLERIKRAFSGGQDFEGTEGPYHLKNLVPTMFSRFVPLMQKGDADGQFQSAIRTAMMYSELAGQAPDAGASPAERDRFLNGIKATATNILIQRAIFGTFLPASPQLVDPQDIENDTIGRLQGLPNLRSEFFEIRKELAEKYPDNFIRANSESIAEFARRYPGELIVNPAAFSVGSTAIAGVTEGFAPYTIEATRWLSENKAFVKANPTVAIALMPKSLSDGDFSNEAYKLQLKNDIRTHKSLGEFYTDLTLSDDIAEYYKTRSSYFAAAKQLPAVEKSIYAKMDAWEDGWRRVHPLASQELNHRANPDFVHAEVAPALDRIVQGVDKLPASMEELRPQVEEMYADYQDYRDAYERVSFYDNAGRANLNREYHRRGDVKWLGESLANMDPEERARVRSQGGRLSALWDLMRVTEGR